jgi:hypothetical protein
METILHYWPLIAGGTTTFVAGLGILVKQLQGIQITLSSIETKLEVHTAEFGAHETLDESRFVSLNRRFDDLLESR